MTDIQQDAEKVFKWGDITTAPGDIPLQSMFALAQRGYTHVLGNEVAAQVAAYKKTEEGKTKSDAELEAYGNEKRKEKLAKILDGSLGVRTAGAPRVTGIDAVMRAIAVERLKGKLESYSKRNGTKVSLPTGDKTVKVLGEDMTRDQLIERELKFNGDKIRAEAERRAKHDADAIEGAEDF